jgi:hypothetical protein
VVAAAAAAGAQACAGAGERFAACRSQPLAQARGCGQDNRLQLVERRRARPLRAAPLEQQQPQLLTRAAAARACEPLARDQPPGGGGSVEQIALRAATLAPARPLALVQLEAGGLEQTREPGAVAARALDRKRRLTERLRPVHEREQAGLVRGYLDAVQLRAVAVERDRNMRVLMRVDTDCHRPRHRLASLLVERERCRGQDCVGQDAGFYQVTSAATRSGAGDRSCQRHRASGGSGHPATGRTLVTAPDGTANTKRRYTVGGGGRVPPGLGSRYARGLTIPRSDWPRTRTPVATSVRR